MLQICVAIKNDPAAADALDAFLQELASGQRTRKDLHADPLMPTRWQVHLACKSDEVFAEQLGDAEIIGLEAMADELVSISDEATNRDTAAAAKVRLQARQWKLERLYRAKFGNKVELNGGLAHYVVELPAPVQDVEQWKKLYANPANQSASALLSGVLNPDPKPH